MYKKLKIMSCVGFAMLFGVISLFAVSNTTYAATKSDFQLRYYAGAPSTVNILSCTRIISASGKDYVRVKASSFYSQVSGGSFTAVGSPQTVKKTIDDTKTYKLTFTGNSVPKAGRNISVKLSLKNYSSALGLSAKGVVMQ